MTERAAYVYGWVYGTLERALGGNYDRSGAKFGAAAMRPYSGFAAIHTAAIREKALTQDVQMKVRDALSEIDFIDEEACGGQEAVQPLKIQGSWQLGRYKGLSGDALPSAKFDIKGKRQAKHMTQQQLAEAMGVDQAVISRWENHTNNPTDENLSKLKEILDA